MKWIITPILWLLVAASPLNAHLDHGVGGERLHFGPLPRMEKPGPLSDRALTFRPPPRVPLQLKNLDLSAGLTISAHVYRRSAKSPDPVVAQWDDFNMGAFVLMLGGEAGSGFSLRWEDGSVTELTGYSVPIQQWAHIIATYDGARVAVYVDGVEAASLPVSGRRIMESEAAGWVGFCETIGRPMVGRLADVAIWDSGIGAEDVATISDRLDTASVRLDPADASAATAVDGVAAVRDSVNNRLALEFRWGPYVSVPQTDTWDRKGLSVAAWVYNRGSSLPGGPIVGQWGVDVADRSFVLYSTGGNGAGFRAFWDDGTQNNLTVVETPLEEWFHCAATYDGRELRLYVNGIPAGRTIAVDKTFAKVGGGPVVGGVDTIGSAVMQGFIDDLGVWPQSLTAEEIGQVANNGPEATEIPPLFSHRLKERPVGPDAIAVVRSEIPEASFFQASAAGDTARVRAFLVRGVDQKGLDAAFFIASQHNRDRVMDLLLERGANIDALLGLGGHTALHAAVSDRRILTVQYLLGRGADVNLNDATYRSPAWGWAGNFGFSVLKSYLLDAASEANLYAAIEHGAPDRAQRILDRDPDSWNLNRALRLAASFGRPGILRSLLTAGADPEVADGGGRKPIDFAIEHSHYEAVDVLRSWRGPAIEDSASFSSRVELLDRLLESGDLAAADSLLAGDPDLVRTDPGPNRCWLERAADVGSPDAGRLLIKRGAPIDRVSNHHTALSWAVTVGATGVAEVILEAGETLDLFTAAGLGRTDDVSSYFGESGVSESSSFTGSTRRDENRQVIQKPPLAAEERVSDALYIASRNGHVETVLFLLGKGADPDFRAEREGTAIYWAAKNGHADVVRELLNAGADPAIPDRYGQNAVQVALRSDNEELKRIFASK